MKKSSIIFAISFFSIAGICQTGIPKAQAMFIYNFSRLMEWPANYKTGPFVIGVIGSNEMVLELETYTNGKRVATQEIVIKHYRDATEIDRCHILFVPFSRSKNIAEILAKIENISTLIITEKNGGIAEGSAINFAVLGDKLRFEISPKNANRHGIKMSSKLQEMAFNVY